MTQQNSGIIDTAYFASLSKQLDLVSARIDKIPPNLRTTANAEAKQVSDELQTLVDRVMPPIKHQYSAILSELEALQPALALLEMNIADLPSVITFLTSFLEHVLTPMLKPYITQTAQITAMTAQVATLTSKITSVASKVQGFTPNIPSFP